VARRERAQQRDYQHTVQVGLDGRPLACLPQNDVNLTSPTPLATRCTDTTTATPLASAFPNVPFKIDDYIAATDATCPKPGVFAANGVPKGSPNAVPADTELVIARPLYQEQYQIDGGKQDRYTVGSDAIGLTQGYYDTTQLPIYKYLTGPHAPKSVIADNFFQAAFGGSFLNHQWLVAAQTPVYANADHSGGATDFHTILGADGHPNNYPLHPSTGLKDGALTVDTNPAGSFKSAATTACGALPVNTIQPTFQPFSSPTAAKLRR
jgi:phospholipase C